MGNRYFRSPLNYQSERFKRGYKVPERFKIPPKVTATALKILYVFLLLSINLILFTGSGNLNIFQQNIFIVPEVLSLFGFSFLVSACLMLIFSFSEKIQNIICVFFTYWFIVVLFNQFAQFDYQGFMGNYLNARAGFQLPVTLFSSSHIIMAFVLSCLFAWFIFKAPIKVFGIYVMLFVFTLLGIVRSDYISTKKQHEFIELYQSRFQQSGAEGKKQQKFIYIMLPNLTSYKYFGALDTPDTRSAQDIITGFFAKNNFEVYPNACNINGDAFLNIIQALNYETLGNYDEHIMKTMLLYKYWKFFNVSDDYVRLKNNQMFDSFKKSGYKISAYKSQGVDLCRKKYDFNVDRCIEKLNHPLNLYSMDIPTNDRTKLLFIEWLSSMNIFNDLSWLYQPLRLVTEPEELPMIGINYNNLYVVNSIKTFDVLLDHIKNDKGRQAYFVYADIPSDMFIYDEFCQIKPQSQWISLQNLPWVKVDKISLKRQAYTEQTKCLYGKLQEFLDKLNDKKLLQNTVMIINGMSGTNNFTSKLYENYDEDVIYNRLTMLAIKAPNNKNISIKDDFCSPAEILEHYLYNAPQCMDTKTSDIHIKLWNKLNAELKRLDISESRAKTNIKIFEQWYNRWSKHNVNYNTDINLDTKPHEGKSETNISSDVPELKNDNLKNAVSENNNDETQQLSE